MNDKLSKFKEITEILNRDVPSSKEVAELVATIIQVVKESKRLLEKQAEQHMEEMSMSMMSAHNRMLDDLDSLEKKCEDAIKKIKQETKSDLDKITRGLYEELKRLEDSIPEEVKLSPVYDRINEVEKKIVPVSPKEIRDNLESLEGDERLDKKAIKGLDEELKRIEKAASTSGGGSRRVFQPYVDDLSSSCDGSNKTFYLSRSPLKTATSQVFGTDFPVILRPTIDFTIANKTLTLASGIPAPNSGATLICTYYA